MAAARWRSLFHPSRNLSASSNGNTFHPAGSDFKIMFSDPKPQADIEEETSTPQPVSSSSIFEDVRASLRKPSQATPKMGLKLNGNESAGSFSLEAFGKSLRIQAEKGPGPVPRPRPSSLKRSDLLLRFARQPTCPPTLELMKMYSYDELGAKLRKLRPEDCKRFSLTELNDRLRKLREMEEEESKYSPGGPSFKVLRESLYQLRMSSETPKKKSSLQRPALLGSLHRLDFTSNV